MAEVIIAEFEVDGISAPALSLMRAAVMHAKAHPSIRYHTIPIEGFCRLAGLPLLSDAQIEALLKEARRGLATWEIIDTIFPDRDDLSSMSWPVFSRSKVDGSCISFEIHELTFDDRLLRKLS